MTNVNYPTDFPTPQLIPVNGITLEVFEAGTQHIGNPIVLCHGWPEHAYSWRHQIPVLVEAGYHVIVPNQRGYGQSSRPEAVTDYDINHLTGDLVALLDHYGYEKAIFIGHDWGANIVWSFAQLHPNRIKGIIALALPYQVRGDQPWLDFIETIFGEDHYFVHFNQKPGVADAILDEHSAQFLRNLFRKNLPSVPPEPGMMMINLAKADQPLGDPIMPADELAVFSDAFKHSGFTSSINWYRNLNRNWQLLADVNPIINHPALMIYGKQDLIPQFEALSTFVPQVKTISLNCGHWIQQEVPEDTNQAILTWLGEQSF